MRPEYDPKHSNTVLWNKHGKYQRLKHKLYIHNVPMIYRKGLTDPK